MTALTVTVPSVVDDTTRDLISLPTCPCGSGPVERFISVGTSTVLGCADCYRACHTLPEVTHHTRSSHATCPHDATPTDRARCRAAHRRGELYVGDGYEDDSITVGSAKGSKSVHVIDGDKLGCGRSIPKTITTHTGTADEVTCGSCISALDDAAA